MEYLIIALKSVGIYLFIIACIRMFGRKELAQLTITDLVFILLISNSVQNAMVGSDTSIQGGMVAAFGLFVANYIFKWLLRKSAKFNKLVQGEEILLVYDGVINEPGMKKAMMTREELDRAIREHGAVSVNEVSLAILECDGNISIVTEDIKKAPKPKKKPQISHNP